MRHEYSPCAWHLAVYAVGVHVIDEVMRRLVAFAVLCGCGGDDGPPPVGPIAATVTHYDYAFDVESRIAHATVTASVETEGDCFELPVRAEVNVGSAQVDGKPAVSANVAEERFVVCGRGHRAGATMTIEVDVAVPLATLSASQVGYSVTRDAQQNPFYYLVSWVGGCDRFGPCDNRPDQFATYTFTVTHPETLMVTCPGTIEELSPTETRCEFGHEGGPTYSTFGIAAYPKAAWVPTEKGPWGSIDRVTVYDRPGNGFADAVTSYNDGFVRYLEQTFGPYPYGDELRILTAPTYWSGFEHPGNIILDDSLHRIVRPSYLHNAQHVLNHEIAHQWAGDQTTLADTYDFVWKEAMAEYLTFVYEAAQEPAAAAQTASAWKGFSVGSRYYPVPEEKPPLFDYYGDVYGPGPMILFRQLEVLSSRDQVVAALQTLLGQPRAISVDDVLAALETSTGLDLDAYADAWIRGTGAPAWPTVHLTLMPGAQTGMLRVQLMTAPEKRCKFRIALRGANASESLDVIVDTFRDGPDQTLPFAMPEFEITDAVVDPLRECLVFESSVQNVTSRSHPWRAR